MTSVDTADRVLPAYAAFGPTPQTLRSILRPEISLAVWECPTPFIVTASDLQVFESIRLTVPVDTVEQAIRNALSARPAFAWYDRLAAHVAMLAAHFADVMGAEDLDVRIENVTGNACWKVHADYVTARLITTCAGRGTEWFDRGQPAPVLCGELAPGWVGLFKGKTWAPDTAILHRSPPIAGTGERRLLIVMDPVRYDGAPTLAPPRASA